MGRLLCFLSIPVHPEVDWFFPGDFLILALPVMQVLI